MLCCSTPRWAPFRSWLRDYDKIQWVAVLFIYIQIACALVGSLGALYNGVLLINLVVALFALIAIESNSQSLGRTYAVLLACAILLDVAWFILFSHAICEARSMDANYWVFSEVAVLIVVDSDVQTGVSSVESTSYQEVDFDLRNSFLNPSNPGLARQNSVSDEILGGSIYDPAYYSSLFEDPKDNGYANAHDGGSVSDDGGTTSAAESSQLKSCISRSFQVICDGSAVRKPQTS